MRGHKANSSSGTSSHNDGLFSMDIEQERTNSGYLVEGMNVGQGGGVGSRRMGAAMGLGFGLGSHGVSTIGGMKIGDTKDRDRDSMSDISDMSLGSASHGLGLVLLDNERHRHSHHNHANNNHHARNRPGHRGHDHDDDDHDDHEDSITEKVQCTDIIPQSSKLVVINAVLPFRNAFTALLDNKADAALIWDEEEQDYVFILTLADFLKFLVDSVRKGEDADPEEFRSMTENATNAPVGEVVIPKQFKKESLVGVDPQDSLQDAAELLLNEEKNFVPVLYQEANAEVVVLHLLSSRRLLSFLLKVLPQEILDLHAIPTVIPHVECVTLDVPLLDVLYLASERGNPAVPVVDRSTGQLKHIFNTSKILPKITKIIRNSDNTLQSNNGRVKLIDIAMFIYRHRNDRIDELFAMVTGARTDVEGEPKERYFQEEGEALDSYQHTYRGEDVVRTGARLGEVTQRLIDSHLHYVVCINNNNQVVGGLDIKYLLKRLIR